MASQTIATLLAKLKREYVQLARVIAVLEGTARVRPTRPTRKLSAAGRERIARAQRKRWREWRAARGSRAS